MSSVLISIPDDKWFHGEDSIYPNDKQLCIVMPIDSGYPMLMQWRKSGKEVKNGYFVEVHNMERENPMRSVKYWMPIELPEEIKWWVLSEIEQHFERRD